MNVQYVVPMDYGNMACQVSNESIQNLPKVDRYSKEITIFCEKTLFDNSELHSCNFMIPALLFYEVNDPLLQVCYKP